MEELTHTTEPDSEFDLHFNEGFHQEMPRRCKRIRVVSFGSASKIAALLVRIDPPCSGELYGLNQRSIDSLVLSALFEGQSFFPVSKWPMQVHVYIPLVEAPELRDHINVAETKNIALGEIRRGSELQN